MSATRATHTPGPGVALCGCQMVGPLGVAAVLADPPPVYRVDTHGTYVLKYCPTHAAAREMLALLRDIEGAADPYSHDGGKLLNGHRKRLDAILARIDGAA